MVKLALSIRGKGAPFPLAAEALSLRAYEARWRVICWVLGLFYLVLRALSAGGRGPFFHCTGSFFLLLDNSFYYAYHSFYTLTESFSNSLSHCIISLLSHCRILFYMLTGLTFMHSTCSQISISYSHRAFFSAAQNHFLLLLWIPFNYCRGHFSLL